MQQLRRFMSGRIAMLLLSVLAFGPFGCTPDVAVPLMTGAATVTAGAFAVESIHNARAAAADATKKEIETSILRSNSSTYSTLVPTLPPSR